MSTTEILLILLAFLLSLGVAAFQYFYKMKTKNSRKILFTGLRFLAVFALLLLLINPQIERVSYSIEKPDLLLAVDNSTSIQGFGEAENVQQLVQKIIEHPGIKERFEISTFTFGEEVRESNEFRFSEAETNIPAVLNDLDKLYEEKTAPTVLITDGNQTYGEDLLFAAQKYDQPLLPVVVGDTAKYRDLEIARVNYNKYGFLNNFLPVEIMVNYSGKEPVETELKVRSGTITLHSEKLSFDEEDNSAVIRAKLPSVSLGVNNYEVRLRPLENEKNIKNNTREFAVEIIDERSEILLLYNVLHPDLGAIKKAIESNKQREVKIQQLGEAPVVPGDYQLIILYQPDRRFKSLMDELNEQNRNTWIITGPETDFRFLNEQQDYFQQEITGQKEEFFPEFNENFGIFQAEDIGYSAFPPLQGNFGSISSTEALEPLLFRKVQNINTNEPLLAIAEEKDSKTAFLFGSDLWKWRSHVFQETGSFQPFDEFIGKLVQFLSSGKRKDRLTVDYEALYEGNRDLVITAEYVDKNYRFDPRGKLNLQLKNTLTDEQREIPFMLDKSEYKVDLSNLPAGNYEFTVAVAGENLRKQGKFRLLAFNVEEQFVRANPELLQKIAQDKQEQLYYPATAEKLISNLLSADSYVPVQKSHKNHVPLIDWYYLLGIIVFALAAEWFLRKYYGYI